MLVDSGSDLNIFDSGIADILGIDLTSGVKQIISGITGNPEPYYVHTVMMNVGGHKYKTTAGFKDGYSNNYFFGIVGQIGFFDEFIVKFDLLKEEVELKERK